MPVITASIGRSIVLSKGDVDPLALDGIRRALTVPNGAREKAIKLGQWGAEELPEYFELFREEGERVHLPRGFAAQLVAGMTTLGYEVVWQDDTSCPETLGNFGLRAPTLRPEQERAVEEFLVHRQGVLQAPTAAGKTVTALDAWRRTGTTGLVLVRTKDLLSQWRDRAREHLGLDVGIIGDGRWEERDLTVAMLQTLHGRQQHAKDLLSRVGMTVFDECHHAPADTYAEVISWCCSRYLLGITATPLDGEWTKAFLEAWIGPVFHVIADEDVEQYRAKPSVRAVRTDFFWENDEGLVDPRAIWRRIIKALERDVDRSYLICRTIAAQPREATQLVVCGRLGYLDMIQERLWVDFGYDPSRIYRMTGRENRTHRELVARLADQGSCVILSTTVADEGVDIPRLDRLHLPWPGRLPRTFIQKAGRLTRKHPEKLPPVVYDYVDHRQGVLLSQFRARLHGAYLKKGWDVQYVDQDREAA